MQAKEYRTVDKSGWGPGPWQDEPDKAQWQDEETGLPCLIVRNGGGALCGYVGVPDTHPWHGKDYDDEPVWNADVHGGLTFADACADTDDESRHICHLPDPGEPDNVWWFGFDCSHLGDLSPKYARDYPPFDRDESYKPVGYVKANIRKLAKHLASAQ